MGTGYRKCHQGWGHFKTRESQRHTLADALDRYAKTEMPRRKDSYERARHLDRWRTELGCLSLADVTPAKLAEVRDKMLTETTPNTGVLRSPATVNRYMAALSHVFTLAVNEWGWLEDSPMRKVSKLKEPRGRIRFPRAIGEQLRRATITVDDLRNYVSRFDISVNVGELILEGRQTRDALSIFRNMTDLTAEEIEIKFTPNSMLAVSAREEKKNVPYSALDMLNCRNRELNKRRNLLLGLANGKSIPRVEAKTVSDIRTRIFKGVLEISHDPFAKDWTEPPRVCRRVYFLRG